MRTWKSFIPVIGVVTLILSLLLSCTSSVQDGQADKLYSLLPPVPPTGDPGLNFPTDPELNLPGLNLKSFLGGEAVKGGQSYPIKWFLEPIDPSDEGLYSTKLQYSKDGGTTWITIVESVPSVGAKLIEYQWSIGSDVNWEGDAFRIRITTTNVYGIKYSKESEANFTIDNTPPVIANSSFKVNSAQSEEIPGQGWTKIEISRSYMSLAFSVSDTLSPVSEFCVKMDSVVTPTGEDPCWKILKNMGITPALQMNITDVPAFVGFVPRNAEIRLWTRDAAGNISTLTGGTGVYNKDRSSIIFNPAKPPEVTNVLISNKSDPSIPPTRDELTTTGGITDKVYIKWKINPNGRGGQLAEAGGVKLEYTTDEENFFPVTLESIKDQDNSANGYCFTDGDIDGAIPLFSGCYTWAGVNIPSGYFRVRVVVTNDVGLVSAASTSPMNSGFFRSVVGNTDIGIGNSAEGAMYFYTGGGDTSWNNPGSLLVTRRGRIYVKDERMGIIVIDPADGVNRVFIKRGDPKLVIQEGEDVDVSLARSVPLRIALDYQDRLLILEKNRVRRVDSNNVISTIIGLKPGTDGKLESGTYRFKDNGLVAGEGKANWYEKNIDGSYKHLTSEGCFSVYTTPGIQSLYYEFNNIGAGTFMWPLPNGDIYFSSSDSWNRKIQTDLDAAPYFAVYKENDLKGKPVQRIYPLRLCGSGVNYNKQDPYRKYDGLIIDAIPGINFNPYTSMVESLSFRVRPPDNFANRQPYGVTFNPRSGRSRGSNTIYPVPSHNGAFSWWGGSSYIPNRKGGLHFLHYWDGAYKYNASYNQWEPIFNTRQNGQCFDGTKTRDCYVDILDLFVTEDNITYFFDRGRIRAISNNKIKTIFGQSRKYGDFQNPSSARLNVVEYLGVWGNDDRIVVYDTREYVAREIQQGISIKTVMGSNGEGKCEVVDGEYSCTTGVYYWGRPSAKINNTVDSSTKVGSLNMDASWWGIHYWDWSTGFTVDRDNGDIYSFAGGGPLAGGNHGFSGIARYFINPSYNTDSATVEKRQGQMIGGAYSASKYFLTTGATSCDNSSAFGCRFDASPDSGNGLYGGGSYMPVIPTLGKDFVTGKKTLIAATHDRGYDSKDANGNNVNSYKHCYMKAISLPNNIVANQPIAALDLPSSLVQHVMGNNDRCVGYGGNGEGLPADGTVMTSNANFPSWHSTTIPHRFLEDEDAMFMSWRGSRRIVKVPFVRSSVQGVGENIITGAAAIVTELTLPRGIINFNYRISSAGKKQFFYCEGGGNMYMNEGGIETQIPFPKGSGISCHDRGKSIEWNKEKTALYFVYAQNGLTGIGEFYVGD